MGQPAFQGHRRLVPVGFLAAACICLGITPSLACPPTKTARFEPGTDTLTVAGGVARGERDCYTLALRYGQRLVILQGTDPATQAVFQLYRPPWRLERANQGLAISGAALPGTEDGRDATRFEGRVPVTGDYLLVIESPRGGGDYRLSIGAR